MRHSGKVALVTGAGSGIGAASARRFAAEGAAVIVADIAEEGGHATAAAIVGAGGKAVFVRCDVASGKACAAAVAAAEERFGGLDILHANAGVEVDKPLLDTTEEEWNRVLAVNLTGTFHACRAAIPAMRRRGGGAIVVTASVNGFATEPNLAAYCASKGGQIMLVKSIALDYAGDRIRANAVCPGWVRTNMTTPFLGTPEGLAHANAVQPAGRVGDPDDIARVASFLASEEAAFMTGSAVVVDGGLASVLNGHRFSPLA